MSTSRDLQLFIGTQEGHLHTASFTPPSAEGSATLRTLHATTEAGAAVTWVSFHPTERILYATDESDAHEGHGAVGSFEIGRDGKLFKVGTAQSGGPAAVSLSVSPDGRLLACANYMGGNISVFLIQPNGCARHRDAAADAVSIVWPSSRKTTDKWERSEPGPDAARQDASHPHSVAFDPTGRFLYSCDLGMDVVRLWTLGKAASIEAAPPIEFPAGTGPRHTLWHRTQAGSPPSFLYIICELSNEIHVFSLSYPEAPSTESPTHKLEQVISTLAPGAPKENGEAAEIALTPDGRHLIASNRDLKRPDVPDTLAIFSVNPAPNSQHLTLVRHFDTGGKDLRHFSLSADGQWLALGAQGSGFVSVLEVDPHTAEMRQVARLDVPKAACAMWRHTI